LNGTKEKSKFYLIIKKRGPKSLYNKFGEDHILPYQAGGKWPVEYVGDKIIGDVKPEEFDFFHKLIITDEISRCGSEGLGTYLAITGIGLPPVTYFVNKIIFLID
jgi:hypothetical protein